MFYCIHNYTCRPKWVKLEAIEYRIGSVIVIGYDGILPLFGKVKAIYLIADNPLINVSRLNTLGLNEHYRSYVVQEPDTSTEYLLALHQLCDYSVLHINNSFEQSDRSSYLCLKWNVEECLFT